MSNFKAAYVPLIALVPWIVYPVAWFFMSVKPLRQEWDKQYQARNGSRQKYGSDTQFKNNWPPDTVTTGRGADDRAQDKKAFDGTKVKKTAELKAKTAENEVHKAQLEALLNKYMAGINRKKLDYKRPDDFMYELLFVQRDREGPHLIAFLHKTYPGLFFDFDWGLPAPPTNWTDNTLPPTGPEGRLQWPVGKASMNLTLYGPYEDVLKFMETFPDKYDRTVVLSELTLTREAFDYKGNPLLRLNPTMQPFVWPENP